MGNIGKTQNHLIMEPLNLHEAPAEPAVTLPEGSVEEHIAAEAVTAEEAVTV